MDILKFTVSLDHSSCSCVHLWPRISGVSAAESKLPSKEDEIYYI